MLGEARALVHDDADAAHLHRWAEELAGGLEGSAGSLPEGEALSTAELRTLQYLQTHLTQAEIGDRLFVTRNTVKTHTGALYRKLRVTTRSAAVERGRQARSARRPLSGGYEFDARHFASGISRSHRRATRVSAAAADSSSR